MVHSTHATLSTVMRGLEPRIYDENPLGISLRRSQLADLMDCWVKPGKDNSWAGACLRRMGGDR